MAIEKIKQPRSIQQPRVVDVSRQGPALTVEVDASEAAELLLSIATVLADEDRDTYELEATRIDEIRAGAPTELLRHAGELLPHKSAALLLGLAYTTPRPRTAAAFLEHLAATDPIEIRLHQLGYYVRGHHVTEPETIRRAAEGDAAAIGELLEAGRPTRRSPSATPRRSANSHGRFRPNRSSSDWHPASNGCRAQRSTASCSSLPIRRDRGST
jgi:hypothetical protein